ncbi:GspE/PulE family protein [Nautilia sp.]
MKVGELFLKDGIISEEQLKKALEYQKKHPAKKLVDILFDLGFISKKQYLEHLSKSMGIGYKENLEQVRLRDIKVPVNILKQTLAVPIEVKYDKAVVAMADPLDWNAQALIKRFFQDKNLEIVLGFRDDIIKVIRKVEDREKVKGILGDIKKELRGEEIKGDESAIMRLIKYVLVSSIERKASDIHIEAEEGEAEIRIRIFGTLYEFLDFDEEIFYAINSRIKLLSGLDVSEKRKPQDGSFSMQFGKNKFDFRVSTLPTIWGESIVIRILDKRNILKRIDDIGISEKNLTLIKKALSQPNGIFLVTGPTGSGKSTTLYAALNEINNTSEKIITVEDPVEYKLRGIQQVQVNAKVGLTFAGALRSILRQDPDIIMIGEIRDLETLEIAVKAALTGHLVISTLHTNDAVSAINRMIDMGADPFMVATSLIGVEAQRLVKTICPYCKTIHKPADVYLDPIKNILPKDAVFYTGKGCEKCNMTGFAGRTLITEVFLNDENLETMISKKKDKLDLLHYLKSKGFKNMFYDGLIKALKGITSLEEVYKVAKL